MFPIQVGLGLISGQGTKMPPTTARPMHHNLRAWTLQLEKPMYGSEDVEQQNNNHNNNSEVQMRSRESRRGDSTNILFCTFQTHYGFSFLHGFSLTFDQS